jgi:hypothetical protein
MRTRCSRLAQVLLLLLVLVWPSVGTAQEPSVGTAQGPRLAAYEIPDAEYNALAALYQNTAGAGWYASYGWLTVDPPCQWENVYCSTSGAAKHVTDLLLASNNLVGSLPAALGDLTELRTAEFYDNQLRGGIPSALGNLTHLTVLNLAMNQLSGAIPATLGQCVALEDLNLSNNSLSSVLPATVGGWTQLQSLDLSGNQISGTLPAAVNQWGSLYGLQVQNNALRGPLPPQLATLSGLSTLNLSYNALWTDDAVLRSFLEARQPDWAATQTVAPANVHASQTAPGTVLVSWTPISYTGDGGYYQVSYATTPGGPYTIHGTTANKSASSYTARGVSTASPTYWVVRTTTPPHGDQHNTLWSDYAPEVAVGVVTTPTPTPTPTRTATPGTPTATATAVTPTSGSVVQLPLILRNHAAPQPSPTPTLTTTPAAACDAYEPNDAPESPWGPLVSGQSYQARLCTGDWEDDYHFDATAPGTAQVRLQLPAALRGYAVLLV